MKTEYEIKVLAIDEKDTAQKLLELGFEKQEPQSFRRYVYDVKDASAWVRVRTDGTNTAITYKTYLENSISGVKELEVSVDSFEAAHELLTVLGFTAKSYQENRRQRYLKDNVEISIDEWPMIPTYMEIEGPDQPAVELYLGKLGLQEYVTTSEPTSYVYKHYGYDIDDYPKLAFAHGNTA